MVFSFDSAAVYPARELPVRGFAFGLAQAVLASVRETGKIIVYTVFQVRL